MRLRAFAFAVCSSLGAQQPPPQPSVVAVVNAASFAPAVAPGSLISIFGANLQGASVDVDGRAAPILYSGPSQINAQLPYETAPGAAALRAGGSSLSIQVSAAAPGVFKVQGDRAALTATAPGAYATVYLTGQGAVSPPVPTGRIAPAEPLSRAVLEVSATVGGVPADVQFAGLAPGFIGLMQVNLRIPQLPAGDHPVVVTIGGAASNAALLPVADWQPALAVTRTGEHVHAGHAYSSSSSLRVTWTPPAAPVHHYTIVASDTRASVRADASAGARAVVLTNLKAATEYGIQIRACPDAACSTPLQQPDTARASTEMEYWAIQGRGSSYATADRIVPDGNVGSWAMRYGAWAGPALDGKIQLYYVPLQQEEKGMKIGEMIAPRADRVEDALSFRGVSGFGLLRLCSPPAGCPGSTSLATNVNLFQAIPLAPEAGGKVRLFFEAGGSDGRTRVLYLDSQDGYAGRDFHAGPPTRCNTLADYSSGGGCEPQVAIPVDGDRDGNPNLRNARQFKILYPTRDSWLWDMRPGTPMWFTTEWNDGRCSRFGFNAAYAVWDGARWRVAYQPDGCPKILAGAQAPMPVHLGGARYKLYFNLHPAPGGPSDPQQAVKPMRLIYADPEMSGDPALADFEDWEPLSSARPLRYLWSTGEPLNQADESRLDDYVIFAPTSDPARLVMYANMSTGATPPFIGSAVLVNP